jgi:hypothetical protein
MEAKIREKTRSVCMPTASAESYEAHLKAFENMKTAPDGSLTERSIPWPAPNNLAGGVLRTSTSPMLNGRTESVRLYEHSS